jgi:hypothetical protein
MANYSVAASQEMESCVYQMKVAVKKDAMQSGREQEKKFLSLSMKVAMANAKQEVTKLAVTGVQLDLQRIFDVIETNLMGGQGIRLHANVGAKVLVSAPITMSSPTVVSVHAIDSAADAAPAAPVVTPLTIDVGSKVGNNRDGKLSVLMNLEESVFSQ